MNAPFRKGETLVIRPHDDNDPLANAYAGKRCQFVRYHETPAGNAHAMVKFAALALPVAFRIEDLEKVTDA